MKYRVVIVDDEPLVRERVRDLVIAHAQFDICAECTDGESALAAINTHNPHVLFLDIKMPKGTGFNVLDAIEEKKLLVIFITAYDYFAVKAFDYAGFDYLVKPITLNRFTKTMQRIITALSSENSKQDKFLAVKYQGTRRKIPMQEISHLEAADNYVKIHTANAVFKKRVSLSKLCEALKDSGFLRVHRSYAINANFVQSIARIYKSEYLIMLRNGRIIPSSKSFSGHVKSLLSDSI